MNIIEHCVLPCLLYGAESWILDNSLLAKLESFQAELAKRILRLPKNTANNIARMALQCLSMRAHILIIKLNFLLKVITDDLSLCARSFRSLAVSDVVSLLLVRIYSRLGFHHICTHIPLSLPNKKEHTSARPLYTFVRRRLSSLPDPRTQNCLQPRGKLAKAIGPGSRVWSFRNH